MAIRLTGRFRGRYNVEYQVDIYDGDFSGTATDFDVNFCRLIYDGGGSGDHYAPIVGSRAEVGISVHYLDTVIPAFIEDYSTGAEDRFYLRISRVLTGLTMWVGLMAPDFAGEEDTAPIYIFKVSATCGLAMLKEVPYHDGSAIYSGLVRITSHLQNALAKLSHTNLFWGTSDIFIKTAVDWWEEHMPATPGADDDPLYLGTIDHPAFYDFSTAGNVDKDVLSCYKVIETCLRAFNCRIMQIEGTWWIEQIPYRTASPYYTRHYSKEGLFLSSAINSGANVIDQTNGGAKLATVNYDFMPALSEANITYKVKSRRNFLAGWQLIGDGNFDQDIDDNNGTATMRFKFTIQYHIVDNGSAPAGQGYFIIPQVFFNIGDNYLKRGYSISNFSAQLDPLTWDGPGHWIDVPINIGTVPHNGSVSGNVTVEFITPPLPSSGSENNLFLSPNVVVIKTWAGATVNPTWFTEGVYMDSPYLEIQDEGTPFVTEEEVLYNTYNNDSATQVYNQEVLIGTAARPNSVGRIRVYNGLAWVNGGYWGDGTGSRSYELGELLTNNILNGRAAPIRRLNGTLIGQFRMHRLLNTTDGRKWMVTACTWDLGDDTMQGAWVELQYGFSGVNSTPIKIKLNPNGTFPTVDPAPPNQGVTSNSFGLNSANAAATVLKPLSFNYTTALISVGDTITSIPLGEASTGSEFLAGDGVSIVNPMSGAYQTFIIDTPPVAGDMTLSVVSQVATYDFPENAYLVVKQNAYAFTPGNWYTFKGTISSNKVIVSGFTLPANDDACYVIVRRQIYQSPDDFTINYGDNSVNFLSGLGLNGQIAYVKAYA